MRTDPPDFACIAAELQRDLAAANARIREIELYALTLKDDAPLLTRLEEMARATEAECKDPLLIPTSDWEQQKAHFSKQKDAIALRRVIGLLRKEEKSHDH